MADNLAAHSALGVERRVAKAETLLSGGMNQENKEIENALEEMIKAVREDERTLYKRLGVLDYQGFLDRLESIRVQELDYLLSHGEIVKHYIRNYLFPQGSTQEDAMDYLRALVENNLSDIVDIIDEEILEMYDQDITEESLEYIRSIFRGKKGYLRYFGKSGQRVGIGQLRFKLSTIRQNERVVPKVEVGFESDGGKLSKEIINKVVAKLQPDSAIAITVAFPTRKAFEEDVKFITLRMTPARWKEPVKKAIDDTLGHIEITRSYAGLVGFLGEIRATAILYRLFGDAAEATGALKEQIKTKQYQIPIDTIVKLGFNYLGFQVKNYTLNEGKASFSGKSSTKNFIDKRMYLSGTMQEILSDLLGAYQFNKPFEDEDLVDYFRQVGYPVEEYQEKVYSRVEKASNNLSRFMESRIGNMLRIGYDFELNLSGTSGDIAKIFSSKKTYYNTFWFIAGEYIPSSAILQGILDSIRNGTLQQLATVNYTITNSKETTLENYYYKNAKKVPRVSEVLQKQSIQYTVILDVASLKRAALNNAK